MARLRCCDSCTTTSTLDDSENWIKVERVSHGASAISRLIGPPTPTAPSNDPIEDTKEFCTAACAIAFLELLL